MSDVSAKRTRELYVYARNKQTSKLRSFAGRRVSSFSKSHRRRPLRASLRTLGVFTWSHWSHWKHFDSIRCSV